MNLENSLLSLQEKALGTAAALLLSNLASLKALGSAVAKRDSGTSAHNFRVTLMALRVGQAVGMDAATMRRLIKGALLHDIGKIAIPDAVLLKPGALDAEETEVMRTHVHHGLDIVHSSPWLAEAADVVGGHHERFDGGGYPAGRAGQNIPLAARVFAVADVFDALASERPYKEAMPVAEVIERIRAKSGTHFDPDIVEVAIPVLLHTHDEVVAGPASLAEHLVDDEIARRFLS